MTKTVVPEVAQTLTEQSTDDLDLDLDASSEKKRGQWGSQLEYILSVIGFSVGLGNVWRFPYICARNGGGAFLIPFFLCLVLCGLPLFLLEVTLGQFSGKGPVHVWSICPLIKGLGVGMVITTTAVPLYYSMYSAWAIYYIVQSCTHVLPWTSCTNSWNTPACVSGVARLHQNYTTVDWSHHEEDNTSSSTILHNLTVSGTGSRSFNKTMTSAEEFWQFQVLGVSSGLEEVGSVKWELVCYLFLTHLLIFLCVVKGVKSAGKAVYVTATVPYLILTVLLIRGLTLPGGPAGARYLLTPDFSRLRDGKVWVEASVQVFYSLGPVWGILINMASYNKFHTNLLRNTLLCTFVSEGTSLYAGLVVFSVLGFLSHINNVAIEDVVTSGPGLGFVIYPEALSQLPLPQLWSVIFFLMLILLALDSMFVDAETFLTAILDERPGLLRWRVPVAAVYCVISGLLGLIFTTQGGMYLFQLIDWYLFAIFPFLAGFLECMVVAWLYGVKRFSSDIEMMVGRRAPAYFLVTWCFVTPVILLVTLGATLSQYTTPTYGHYVYPKYATVIGWCLAMLPVCPVLVKMVQVVARQQGSLLQRVRKAARPDSTWGPSIGDKQSHNNKAIASSSPLTESSI